MARGTCLRGTHAHADDSDPQRHGYVMDEAIDRQLSQADSKNSEREGWGDHSGRTVICPVICRRTTPIRQLLVPLFICLP